MSGKYRTHKCARGHTWTAVVVMSQHTPNISGESTQYCPVCGSRTAFSTPHFDVEFSTGDCVRIRDTHVGPGDERYAGRMGAVVTARTSNGYIRVHLDGTSCGESVLLHPESIDPVFPE